MMHQRHLNGSFRSITRVVRQTTVPVQRTVLKLSATKTLDFHRARPISLALAGRQICVIATHGASLSQRGSTNASERAGAELSLGAHCINSLERAALGLFSAFSRFALEHKALLDVPILFTLYTYTQLQFPTTVTSPALTLSHSLTSPYIFKTSVKVVILPSSLIHENQHGFLHSFRRQ